MIDVYKKLWPELKPHLKVLFAVMILGIIVGTLKFSIGPLTEMLTNAWTAKDLDLSLKLTAALGLVWIAHTIPRYFHTFWMKYTANLITIRLRQRLMDKYLTLNLAFFQKFMRGSGGLISRMIHDITIIQEGVHKVSDLVREPFIIVYSIIYLIIIDWKLVIFILLAFPFISMTLSYLGKSLNKYNHRNQESMEDLTKILKESLDGTRIVQSYNLEPEMRHRFKRHADQFLTSMKKVLSREEAIGPISESLMAFSMTAIFAYISFQITSDKFSMGDFTGFLVTITLLQDGVKKLQQGHILLQRSAVALDRLHSVLDSDNLVPQLKNPKPFPKDWTSIEFRNVNFAFDKKPVLKNINLTVNRGEVIALVGSSGSGKSTMINLLERFFDPIEGDILIAGTPIREFSLKELRQNMALVAQDVFLFGDTIQHNIQMGNMNKPMDNVIEAAKTANAHNFIKSIKEGYKSRSGDQGNLLSGGEKQRISIARAVLKDAPILLLDEATSALDSESEQEVQKGLDQLMKSRTTFVIAHRLSTIMNADRIIVLKEGKIIEQGTHEALIQKKGEYFRFQKLQTRV